jgi:3-methyl-2-oxobutanoate hydroxymethyltransferase
VKTELSEVRQVNMQKQHEKLQNVTVPEFIKFKRLGRRIVMVTAYDYPSALLADLAGIDSILVGDSVGTTVLGYDSTLPVTLDEIIHHVRAVRRGVERALLIADLPFGAYQADPADAVRSAARLLKEGGAQAVKVEGGAPVVETVRRLTNAGIPTMGHLGLTPQSVHMFGGHRAQGKDTASALRMLDDAAALEEAGAFGIVLEAIPMALAKQITAAVEIPTIGIGAGLECDGQVQVWHDLLGIIRQKPFRHAKQYADLGDQIHNALQAYASQVRNREFPSKEHSL